MREENKKYLAYIILAILLLILWEYAAKNQTVKLLLSSPSSVLGYFNTNGEMLWEATLTTFYESILGLLIATLFSFVTMVVCFYFPKLMDFVLPIMVTSQVIPLITLAPLFILIFGIGITAKVMMAALLCFFPIFINFATGVKLISKNIKELLFIYNANTTQKIFNVYFPLALPNIMTGLKVSSTLAVIGAIVGEFSGAEIGLGRNLFISALKLEPELMMCSLILSSSIGMSMFWVIQLIETKLGNWYLKN
jgi:NitT/TauT family transport system permease protein